MREIKIQRIHNGWLVDVPNVEPGMLNWQTLYFENAQMALNYLASYIKDHGNNMKPDPDESGGIFGTRP